MDRAVHPALGKLQRPPPAVGGEATLRHQIQRDIGAPPAHYTTGSSRVFTPLSWTHFFDRQETIETSKGRFKVYIKGGKGPLILLLHGGGHSALSWACFAKELSSIAPVQIAAPDLRGHGLTEMFNDADEHELSIDAFEEDMQAICSQLQEKGQQLIVMGHSMGGAVATHLASRGVFPSLAGLIVIDVVEGTAMQALSAMSRFIKSRPSSFPSEEAAVRWSIRAGQLKNSESARVSMPGQIRKLESSEAAPAPPPNPSDISEADEEEGAEDHADPAQKAQKDTYVWRVDLLKTEPHWHGWFDKLSSTFLRVPAAKMLVLAGMDRLDKDLTIGQMQGKFQLHVVANSGHSVHEDASGQLAATTAEFLKRNRFVES